MELSKSTWVYYNSHDKWVKYFSVDFSGIIVSNLANQKRESSVSSLLIGWNLRPFPENTALYLF